MANNAGSKNPAFTKRGRFNPNPTRSGSSGDMIDSRPVRVFRAGKWRKSRHATAV